MTTTPRNKQRRQRKLFAAIAGWALLGAASTGIVACTNANAASDAPISATTQPSTAAATTAAAATTEPTTTEPTTTIAATTAAATTEAAAASTYADGTYTASGSYSSPGGTESISITLTLTGDVITTATAEGDATSGPSSEYQSEFVENFATLIVGKDIADVSLDKVAGSSLTSGGFNAAVETIKSDALA